MSHAIIKIFLVKTSGPFKEMKRDYTNFTSVMALENDHFSVMNSEIDLFTEP